LSNDASVLVKTQNQQQLTTAEDSGSLLLPVWQTVVNYRWGAFKEFPCVNMTFLKSEKQFSTKIIFFTHFF